MPLPLELGGIAQIEADKLRSLTNARTSSDQYHSILIDYKRSNVFTCSAFRPSLRRAQWVTEMQKVADAADISVLFLASQDALEVIVSVSE